MKDKKPWFEEWFDSPFYHLLYSNRDQNEAKRFISNLMEFLQPSQTDELLDLACGKGRHALEMANHGFNVTGIDLSANSITEAQKLENDRLKFHIGDMRHVHFENRFNYIFNLFTSFGYFESMEDHSATLQAIKQQLKPNGLFIIDYLNADKIEHDVKQNPTSQIKVEGVEFRTKKRLSSQFISKEIEVIQKDESHTFYEHVWRLNLSDFEELLKDSGFAIQTIFGDYELKKFNKDLSDRLIIVAGAK